MEPLSHVFGITVVDGFLAVFMASDPSRVRVNLEVKIADMGEKDHAEY